MGGVALNLVADRNALAAGDPRPGGISVIAGTHSRATAREATEAANTAGGQTAAGSSFPLLVKQRRQIASPVDHGRKRPSLGDGANKCFNPTFAARPVACSSAAAT